MTTADVSRRARELARQGVPCVIATVVRAQRPASARPGNGAVVLADGTIEGFVGGVCTEQSVRAYSLKAIDSGEPVLLRVLPDADERGGESVSREPGTVIVQNPCLSGGAVEIFLEPVVPVGRELRITRAETAVDPICGMTVAVAFGTPALQHEGETVYFCCEGCRSKFEAQNTHAVR
jgi:xanthine dehydrogenase accessory factor